MNAIRHVCVGIAVVMAIEFVVPVGALAQDQFYTLNGRVLEAQPGVLGLQEPCANGLPARGGDVHAAELSAGIDQRTGSYSLLVPAPWWKAGRLVVFSYPGFAVVSPRANFGGEYYLPRTPDDAHVDVCVYNLRTQRNDTQAELFRRIVADEFFLTPWVSTDAEWGCSASDALADEIGAKLGRSREEIKASVETWLIVRTSEGLVGRYVSGDKCRDRHAILRGALSTLVELATPRGDEPLNERLAAAFYNFGLLKAELGTGHLTFAKDAFELVLRSIKSPGTSTLARLAKAELERIEQRLK